ncbi:MAG: hypothetical protein IKI21_10590 [Oscillospiraceae bacterium]|nr:hypothetical protein [Oscillospiraceae bacterium]
MILRSQTPDSLDHERSTFYRSGNCFLSPNYTQEEIQSVLDSDRYEDIRDSEQNMA